MDFNPDEYLKDEFNPDEYLGGFDPDAYLSGAEPQVSHSNNTVLDYLNPATLNDIAAGGLAGAFGNEQERDRLFSQAQARLAKSKDRTMLDALSDTSTAGLDLISGAVGVIAGGVAGTARALLDGPSAGLETAKNIMSKSTYSHLVGRDKEMAESPAYQAAMLPMGALTAGLETSNKGYQEIAKAAGASPEVAKQIGDAVELGLIAVPGLEAGYHGVKAGKEVYSQIKETREQLKELKKLEELIGAQTTPSDVSLAKQALPEVIDRMSKLEDYVSDLIETGQLKDTDTFNTHIEALRKQYADLKKRRDELTNISEGKSKDANELNRALAIAEKTEQIKAERNYARELLDPEEVAKTKAANEALQEKAIQEQQATGPTIPDATTDPVGYAEYYASLNEPKTTPTEVALQKIVEAQNMSKAELADKVLATEERLAEIPDTPENSSIRENIAQELKVFDDILNDRPVDYSWFEGKQEQPLMTEAINIEAPKPVFNTVEDIFNHADDVMQDLVDNASNFFTRSTDRQYFLDNRIAELPGGKIITTVLNNMLDKIGLQKDRIFITLEDALDSGGKLRHYDDTSIIRLNKQQLEKYASTPIDSPIFKGLSGKNLATAKLVYAVVRVASHEMGHIFLNKYIKSFGTEANINKLIKDFEAWKVTNKLENVSFQDWYNGDVSATKLRDIQQHFHEFAAERMTNYLLKDADILKGMRKDRTGTFRSVLEAGYQTLKNYGMKFLNKDAYFDDVIRDIIDWNKELVTKFGDTIWERQDILQTDDFIFKDKNLKEVLDSDIVQGMLPRGRAEKAYAGYDQMDHPSFSERAAAAIGKGIIKVSETIFNRNNVVDMDFKNKPLTTFHQIARNIDFQVESITNRLLYGDVMPKDVKFYQVFSKVKNADSAFNVLQESSNYDKYVLHDLFKRGFEEGLEYADTLEKYGSHLTDKQKMYYNTLAKTFDRMYEESVKAQQGLDKKYELPRRAGWYPSVRSGRYSVSISYGDILSHVQHFSTKLQAEKFKEKLINSKIKEFNIGDVVDTKDQPKTFGNTEVVENIANYFTRLMPTETQFFNDKGKQLIQSMLEKGGKLGKHHEFRQNVGGYMGSEFFKNNGELGESFGLAIEQAIAEKGMQIKEMYYKSKLQPILENSELKQTHPNTIATMQTMFDSALGRHVSKLDDFQEAYRYIGDKTVDEFLKVFGKEKTSDKAATTAMYDTLRSQLYLWYMMPKAVFSTVGQLLSVTPMTVGKMSYERPLGAYKDLTVGTLKMLTGDKELWDALKEVSQKYNVFEPQYVESLTLHKSGPAMVEAIKDWALLRAPGKGFESGSRVWAFSIMFEHAKQLGMNRQKAIQYAMRKTGDALNLYDASNTPPIFEKLGFVGDLTKPLASFGQNQLGNTIAMAKYGLSTNPKKWMPFVSFTVLSMASVGGLGLQFVKEYEELRRWMIKNDYGTLPSILDILASKREGLDDVISPETRTLGLLSNTGYDIASSARSNLTLPALAMQQLTAGMHTESDADTASLYDTMPVLKSALKIPASVTTLIGAMAGNETTGSVKKAMDVLAPAGHVGYGIKEVMGINRTTIGGKNTSMKMVGNEGQAGGKRTQEDIIAGSLGTQTTKGKMGQLRDYQVQEDEKIRTAKLNKYAIMAVEQGDPKWIKKLIDLGENSNNINNKLELEYIKRLVPLEQRLMINANGKIIRGRGERAAQGLFKFGMGK